MRTRLSSLKVQLGGLVVLLVGSALYCLADGEFSLWTPDQQGHRLYGEADYSRAAKRFVDPMWQGVALFRAGEFDEAALLFAGYDTAEAAFNQGNALVMQGKYEAAVERYARALELQPGWQDATVNRGIAQARADALKKEGGDMTGGKLGADEIVLEKSESSPSAGEQQVTGGQEATDAELRAIWLRQVQTRPADFLRAKFAAQYATRKSGGQ
jgi:Ca-activated chloride channel family protein